MFEKLIRRVGLMRWPRVFQNLRSGLETDLMKDHPIHVVTAWVGNTPKGALGHDLQTVGTDIERAVRGDARSDAAHSGRDRTGPDTDGRTPGKRAG